MWSWGKWRQNGTMQINYNSSLCLHLQAWAQVRPAEGSVPFSMEQHAYLQHGVTCIPALGFREAEAGHLAESAGATVLAIDPYQQASQQISNHVHPELHLPIIYFHCKTHTESYLFQAACSIESRLLYQFLQRIPTVFSTGFTQTGK